MSIYSKVALALWSEDYTENKKLADLIKELRPDYEKSVQTPDTTYLIYYWDFTGWFGEKVTSLLQIIEPIRHSLIEIREDGTIVSDVNTCDAKGCDEEFEEILSWDAEVHVWDNGRIHPGISEKRLSEILDAIVENTMEGSERETAKALLTDAGMTKEEMLACGYDELFNDVLRVTLPELNQVLAPLEFKAVKEIYQGIVLIDLQGTCALEDEVFDSPADVIKRIKEPYLTDHFLNGEICCNHDRDFSTFKEAEKTAREKGYHTEASLIQIIIRGLGE